MKFSLSLAMLGSLVTGVSADGIVKVQSDTPADVLLDGELAGEAPLTISRVPKGMHTLEVTTKDGQETRQLKFHVPASVGVEKNFQVTFAPPPPAPPATYDDDPPRHHRRKNYHVRRRNVALGVTALGVLTHSNLLTGLGIGGAVMNEVSGHDRR